MSYNYDLISANIILHPAVGILFRDSSEVFSLQSFARISELSIDPRVVCKVSRISILREPQNLCYFGLETIISSRISIKFTEKRVYYLESLQKGGGHWDKMSKTKGVTVDRCHVKFWHINFISFYLQRVNDLTNECSKYHAS